MVANATARRFMWETRPCSGVVRCSPRPFLAQRPRGAPSTVVDERRLDRPCRRRDGARAAPDSSRWRCGPSCSTGRPAGHGSLAQHGDRHGDRRRRVVGGWAAPFDSSPGYSYLLAGLYVVSGRRWMGPAAVQLVLGAMTSVLVYALARRLRDHAVGVVAGLLAALYLPAVFYEGLLVKFALLPFVTALTLLGLQRVRDGRVAVGAPDGHRTGRSRSPAAEPPADRPRHRGVVGRRGGLASRAPADRSPGGRRRAPPGAHGGARPHGRPPRPRRGPCRHPLLPRNQRPSGRRIRLARRHPAGHRRSRRRRTPRGRASHRPCHERAGGVALLVRARSHLHPRRPGALRPPPGAEALAGAGGQRERQLRRRIRLRCARPPRCCACPW